jgi:hypothetical protein
LENLRAQLGELELELLEKSPYRMRNRRNSKKGVKNNRARGKESYCC